MEKCQGNVKENKERCKTQGKEEGTDFEQNGDNM